MAGPFPTGRFIWYELLTTTEDAAKDFYLGLTGWKAEAWEGAEPPYTFWMNGRRPVGGLMKLPEEAAAQGAPPHWVGYIATPDVEETVVQAKGLGAELLAGIIQIPTVGKIAFLKDPQGAVFAAYTPENEPPDQPSPPGNGDFSWHDLATTDHAAGFEFYSALFGWEKTDSVDMGGGGIYQMYGRPGEHTPLGGMYTKPPEMPGPPHWLLYITVPDMQAAVKVIKSKGGQVLHGPMEVSGGDFIAQCRDPQGAAFAIHALAKTE